MNDIMQQIANSAGIDGAFRQIIAGEKPALPLAAEIDRLRNINADLLDTLQDAEEYLRNCANAPSMADKCRAAIAKAEAK